MASPPLRDELAGNPTNAEFKLGIGKLWDYVTGLLGNTSTVALDSEKKLARESLGIGSFGFKNRFINPEFLSSQEFGSDLMGVTAGGGIRYHVDRWYSFCSGANMYIQRISGVSDRKYSLRISGASGNTVATLGQRIESINCADLKNQNVVCSFKSKASTNKTITWTAYYANTENIFSSKTIIATGTLSITTVIDAYSFVFNAGSNAGNGIAIEFSLGPLGAGETIDFDQFQIEKSAVKTEFETRSIQQEVFLCKRYFNIFFMVVETGSIHQTISLPTPMRAAPTIAGGGSGFTVNTPNTTTLSVYQSGRGGQTLALSAEL